MILWRGRCFIFRQYNPQKSHKHVLKLYKPWIPEVYTFKFKIYAVKDDDTGNDRHSKKIVLHLMSDLLDSEHLFYEDSQHYFVSKATKKQTYYCCMLRPNRRGTRLPDEKN